jgi:hypothetical protein
VFPTHSVTSTPRTLKLEQYSPLHYREDANEKCDPKFDLEEDGKISRPLTAFKRAKSGGFWILAFKF